MSRQTPKLFIGLVLLVLALLALLLLQPALLWERLFADSLAVESGEVFVPGLAGRATIRRDALGIPVVEAESMADLAFATGWAMASDRIEQMEGARLIAQGRLAELVGPAALDMDIFMRALDLQGAAEVQFKVLSPRLRSVLESFSAGVNAWLAAHQEHLPMGLALSGHVPAPWQPINSVQIFALLNHGLGVNLQEELAYLAVAKRVGVAKAPWLFPVYPDEPLPFAEAAKLTDADLQTTQPEAVAKLLEANPGLWPKTVAASNNWGIAGQRTGGGKSIIANDTHLLLSHPPVWMLMQMRSPGYKAGGIAIAGIPGIIAGSNGKIAWGMTMVMADTQDLYVERLRQEQDDQLSYQFAGQWLPAQARKAVFHIKGAADQQRTLWSTQHGPLLQDLINAHPVNKLLPAGEATQSTQSTQATHTGLALQQALAVPDESMDSMMQLGQVQTFAEAKALLQKIRFIALNIVYGDADHIGWQVTGRYPLRKAGKGHLPSPGWNGDYDWQGFVPAQQHPHAEDPASGWLATANHRTVLASDGGPHLSSSWYYPERFERIAQVLESRADHDLDSSIQLQFDRTNVLVPKAQAMLKAADMASALAQAIQVLPADQAAAAQAALEQLLAFDGKMAADAVGATYFAMFEHQLVRHLLLDELGPDDSVAWQSLLATSGLAYSAEQDHLLGRADSPFWDDITTPVQETKADILARSLAAIAPALEKRLGTDSSQWQWGQLHTYTWKSAATEFAEKMQGAEALVTRWVGKYLDRGPYPAGGDRNTPNVSGNTTGDDFYVWNIPAMRLIVDFNSDEPLHVINSGGQSANPLSPHYDDGIAVWLKPGNRVMPLTAAAIDQQYTRQLVLKPSSRQGVGE